jgi:hypothetical protein
MFSPLELIIASRLHTRFWNSRDMEAELGILPIIEGVYRFASNAANNSIPQETSHRSTAKEILTTERSLSKSLLYFPRLFNFPRFRSSAYLTRGMATAPHPPSLYTTHPVPTLEPPTEFTSLLDTILDPDTLFCELA